MRAMDRVVTEYEVSEDGELRPMRSGAWRVEHATGEAGLHRRLAALRPTPSAIARAASTYGPLRLRADALSIFPAGFWDEVAVVTAQDNERDWSDVRDWVASGCDGPTPAALRRAMPLLQALASFPPQLRAYATLFLEGASPKDRRDAAGQAGQAVGEWHPADAIGEMINAIDLVAAAGGPDALLAGPEQEGRTPCGDAALGWAVDFYGSVQEVLAGQGQTPMELDVAANLSGMLGAIPDLLRPLETFGGGDTVMGRLITHLRQESVEDWIAAKGEMAQWAQAIDIRKRADRGALTAADWDLLDRLVESLLDGISEGLQDATLAGELAALVLPRLRRRLERRLAQLGAWPYPADRPVGTYARALWAARRELTDERPPQQCALEGCRETFPAHGNRRHCDSHRLSRDRDRKRVAAQ